MLVKLFLTASLPVDAHDAASKAIKVENNTFFINIPLFYR